MSGQSEAKEAQGYVAKATPQTCGNCVNYRSYKQLKVAPFGKYESETNMRCGLGGFKVKKMGTCLKFEMIF